MDRNLVYHVRPHCIVCSPYTQELDQAIPATRAAYVPTIKDHKDVWFFCDKCNFESSSNGRGFDPDPFLEDYGSFPPPHEWKDFPHAAELRLAMEKLEKKL